MEVHSAVIRSTIGLALLATLAFVQGVFGAGRHRFDPRRPLQNLLNHSGLVPVL
ncbi:MAG TPA: hypothetical protein VFM35_04585 [Candidatus Binatia bacterium]|nr:hypothetical protein [Candidatus Binatia bacterium]